MDIRLSEILLPNFIDSWRADNKFTYCIEKGGRDSGKSSKHALRMVYNRMITDTSGACIRRFATTLHGSVYQDISWAIRRLGVEHLWYLKKSPLEAIYKPKGTKILFRGVEGPDDRIKGMKDKFPIKDCLFDEVADYRCEDDLDVVIDTILRSEIGDRYLFLLGYNPPKRKGSWLNKKYETHIPIPDTFIHHSTVYDNKYAAKQMIDRANALRIENELKWRWRYMGEPIGGGLVPFENLEFRTITDAEYSTFDNIIAGVDWGYANNLFVYLRMHYDHNNKILYFLDEYKGLKLSNDNIIDWILRMGFMERITADSASPKDIAYFKDRGIDIRGAKKGPGSIESGERWLDSLKSIVIDFKRTPLACTQFENIDYDVDSHGEMIARLEDKENDAIDAARYGCEHLMLDRKTIY
jgi:PBSX family phage terminase large subunit